MLSLFSQKPELLAPDDALPGRASPIATAETHYINGRPLKGPYAEGLEQIQIGMGCFWGVERLFWDLPGVWVTAVGYASGITPNPTYEEVCTGGTGHNEVVLVVYDPASGVLDAILKQFWENHDPTQGMRQGNDRGTQYRSGLYTTTDEQVEASEASRDIMAQRFIGAGFGAITTEIKAAGPFFFAEDYHQQYLAKNPGGYCNHGPNGVSCPIGTGA